MTATSNTNLKPMEFAANNQGLNMERQQGDGVAMRRCFGVVGVANPTFLMENFKILVKELLVGV